MGILTYVLTGLYIVLCLVLMTMILSQKKRSSALSGMTGMGDSGSTYWDKNKGRSFEGKLEFYTKIMIAIFFAVSFILSFFNV